MSQLRSLLHCEALQQPREQSLDQETVSSLANCRIPGGVDAEMLCKPSSEARQTAMQWLYENIDNPMKPMQEREYSAEVAGHCFGHSECRQLSMLVRMLNRVENQWRKLCRYILLICDSNTE